MLVFAVRAGDHPTHMRWDATDILESTHGALVDAACAADAEQAVYGIDALDELALHPILQRGLADTGYGVWPEQAFPTDRVGRKKKSEGKRCDIVLTHDDAPLVDPDAEATLFSEPDAVPLEAAYWLEVKTVAQFTDEGSSRNYAKELLSPVRADVRKLAQDPLIYYAALLLILFTADEKTANADLVTWQKKCLDKHYPVAPPIVRAEKITDRMGNARMTTALFPIRRL